MIYLVSAESHIHCLCLWLTSVWYEFKIFFFLFLNKWYDQNQIIIVTIDYQRFIRWIVNKWKIRFEWIDLYWDMIFVVGSLYVLGVIN